MCEADSRCKLSINTYVSLLKSSIAEVYCAYSCAAHAWTDQWQLTYFARLLSKVANHYTTMSLDPALPRHMHYMNGHSTCTAVQAVKVLQQWSGSVPPALCSQKVIFAQGSVLGLLAHQMTDRAGEVGRLRSSKGICPLSSW